MEELGRLQQRWGDRIGSDAAAFLDRNRHGKGLEAEFFEIPTLRNGRSGRNQLQDEEC